MTDNTLPDQERVPLRDITRIHTEEVNRQLYDTTLRHTPEYHSLVRQDTEFGIYEESDTDLVSTPSTSDEWRIAPTPKL
jgi:hypothetical protein